jgi:hypothetical protein
MLCDDLLLDFDILLVLLPELLLELLLVLLPELLLELRRVLDLLRVLRDLLRVRDLLPDLLPDLLRVTLPDLLLVFTGITIYLYKEIKKNTLCIIIMDRRIEDVKLGTTLVLGVLAIYFIWTTYNGFKGSKTIV